MMKATLGTDGVEGMRVHRLSRLWRRLSGLIKPETPMYT